MRTSNKSVKLNAASSNNNVSSNNSASSSALNNTVQSSSNNATSASNNVNRSSDSLSNSNQNIYEQVKDYIINGQNNLSSAEKLNWSKRFLDQVDLKTLYKQYTSSGGNADNVEDFAKYITLNAPCPSNWQELFEEDYYDSYGKKLQVTKFTSLGNSLYQVYVNQNGAEVPFVVVSSRTGYFHG
jgi:hypothetical protein